jgi:HEAT repeat protein
MSDIMPACATSARWYADAAYGLTEIGTAAVPALLDLLATAAPSGRKHAAFALGETATDDAASVRAPCHATRDAEPGVRINAVEALGLKPGSPSVVPALGDALHDENRYVGGYAVEALERIASPQAMRTLIPFLKTARWCPHTTSRSIF